RRGLCRRHAARLADRERARPPEPVRRAHDQATAQGAGRGRRGRRNRIGRVSHHGAGRRRDLDEPGARRRAGSRGHRPRQAAGVLRRRAQLDRMLELATADPRLHDVLRLGAYQLRALARVPAYAAVSTSVELARALAGEKAARYVNQALRKIARETGSGKRETNGATHPSWLVARWQRRFGPTEADRLVAWNDTKPTFTIQPARWSVEALTVELRKAGFGVEDAPYGAGLRVPSTNPVSRFPFRVPLPG